MEAALQALAEGRRREILALLRERERSAGEIAAHFAAEVTRPAISQHLAVLRAAGLVTERRDGPRRLYSIRPEGFAELRCYLEQMWDTNLGRLQQVAEAAATAAEQQARKDRHGDAQTGDDRT